MMNANVTDLQAQLERVCEERDALREALDKSATDFEALHTMMTLAPPTHSWEHQKLVDAIASMIKRARTALGDS